MMTTTRAAVLCVCFFALAITLSGCGGGGSTTTTTTAGPRPTRKPTPKPTPAGPHPTPKPTPADPRPTPKPTPAGPRPTPKPTPHPPPTPMACPAAQTPPALPDNALAYNGKAWPAACFNGTEEQHFFIIGDWGGVFPHTTFAHKRPAVKGLDAEAQMNVAQKMADVAKTLQPKFVLNVGDNIYPGGIDIPGTCDISEGKFDAKGLAGIVMANTYEAVYKGPGLDGVEWWGVFGNHDYGGYYFSTHWDQFIYYTWGVDGKGPNRWITPAQYWSRTVQYNGFTADFFFIDNNINDVKEPSVDLVHNICSTHNAPHSGCNGTSITSPATCQTFFQDLWSREKTWLTDHLEKSTADWQIIVSHYPPTFDPAQEFWNEIFAKYGVDLYVAGHTHQQQFSQDDAKFSGVPYIISGGGGGIFSEITPTPSGDDDSYGFVDVSISKTQLKVDMYSHGGLQHKTIVRSSHVVKPRANAAEVFAV